MDEQVWTAQSLTELQRKKILEHTDNLLFLDEQLKSLSLQDDVESLVLLNISNLEFLRWNTSKICEVVPNLYPQKFNSILDRNINKIFRLVVVNDLELFYMNGKVKTREDVVLELRRYADILAGVKHEI